MRNTLLVGSAYLGKQQQHNIGLCCKPTSLLYAMPVKCVHCMSSMADVACLADT